MKCRLLLALNLLALNITAHAGGIPDHIFSSGFEFDEQCIVFEGFNEQINVSSVAISGSMTLNGGPFPNTDYDDALISLRDRVTGDVVLLGNTHDQHYSINIVPGRYDVLYRVQTPGPLVPRNTGAVLMEDVPLLADGVLNINVQSYTISGDYKVNGGAFPASAYDHGLFHLVSENAGRLEVGDSNLLSFANVPVLAGNYEVRFEGIQSDQNITPANTFGFVRNLNISGNSSGLVFNVLTTALSGNMSHNGAPFPVSEYEDGNFYLETDSGDKAHLGNSHFGSYSQKIISGSYDVYWDVETPSANVPVNERARISSDVDISGGTLNINVVSHLVAGNFTLNGGLFPNSVFQTGRIVLRDQAVDEDSVLGLSKDGTYQHHIIQGSYDFIYQHQQGENVPQNKDASVATNVLINNGNNRNINVSSRLYSTSVYQNGMLFPPSALQMGNILLRGQNNSDVVFMGKTSLQHLSANVVPGSYDVYYSHLIGTQVPQNQMGLVQKDILITQLPSLVDQGAGGGNQLNVSSMIISGSMYLDEESFPVSDYDDGTLTLHWNGDRVDLANTHDQTFSKRVLMQRYWIHYSVETFGETVPENGDAWITCALLNTPPF